MVQSIERLLALSNGSPPHCLWEDQVHSFCTSVASSEKNGSNYSAYLTRKY